MKCLSFTCFLANNLALIHLSLNCISAINDKVRSHHLEIIEEWKNTVEIVKNSWPWGGKHVVYQFLVGIGLLQGSVRRSSGVFWTYLFFYCLWSDPHAGSKSREELMEWLRAYWTTLPKSHWESCLRRRDQKSLAWVRNTLKPKGRQGYFPQIHWEGREGEILGRGEV